MAGPSVTLSLVDPGAAKRPVDASQIPIYIDIAEGGSTSEVKTFTKPDAIETEYTRGALVDIGKYHLAIGNKQVKLLRVAASTAGVATAPSGTGAADLTGTPVSGTPTQFLSVRVEIITAPTTNVASGDMVVRYSLDNWTIPNITRTWSPNTTVPASGVLPLSGTGLSINWTTTAAPVAGELFTFTTTPGEYDATAIATVESLVDTAVAGDFTMLVFGDWSTAALANTASVAIEAVLLALFNKAKFCGGLMGGGREGDSTLIAAIASSESSPPFLSMGYKLGYCVNPTAQIARARIGIPQHQVAAAHLATMAISTDPARTANGALRNVVGVEYDAADQGDALHDARVSTFRTWLPASQGIFIQRQRLFSAAISNFTTWPHAAIMIQALKLAHAEAFLLIAETLRKNADGTMDARDRKDIEESIQQTFDINLLEPLNVRGTRGHVSSATVEVDSATVLPAVNIDIRISAPEWPYAVTFTLQYV